MRFLSVTKSKLLKKKRQASTMSKKMEEITQKEITQTAGKKKQGLTLNIELLDLSHA